MMLPELSNLAAAVSAIARQAGAVILDIYRNEAAYDLTHKADNSPLTAADRASNDLINRALAALPWVAPVVSEENPEPPFAERSQYPYYWLVDPLDGTKGFVNRDGDFTVNIALIAADTAVLGVVYAPVYDALYWGVQGQGAWRQQPGQPTQRLATAPFRLSDAGLKVLASRNHRNDATNDYISQLNAPELVSRGSALKMLLVAAGEAHLYPRLGPTSEWDTAAAQVVVEEAGGQVLNPHTGTPLRYNKPSLLNPHFVVYGQLLD